MEMVVHVHHLLHVGDELSIKSRVGGGYVRSGVS